MTTPLRQIQKEFTGGGPQNTVEVLGFDWPELVETADVFCSELMKFRDSFPGAEGFVVAYVTGFCLGAFAAREKAIEDQDESHG